VAVTDLNLAGAQQVADEISGAAYELDVRSDESIQAAVTAAEADLGPVDALINNAGYDEWGFFTKTDPDLWDRVLAVNLRGVIAVTHAVLPGMQERRRGRIVNTASEAGRVGSSGSAIYSAAKAGVIGFTVAASWGAAIRRQLDFPADVMAWILSWVLLSGIFLAFAWWLLPHAASHWTEVAPGAALVGVAVILLGVFNWLILYPWLSEKEETYGVLGVAAGLLFGFFLIGRTIELSASLNAVLAKRRSA